MSYRLGKSTPLHDPRTLKFGDYVDPSKITLPASVDYGAAVPAWPMYDNDRYGDCTCAAAAHMIQDWTANAGSAYTPNSDAVLEFYEHFVGTPPPPDEGCKMGSVLRYWRRKGLDGHGIIGWAQLKLQDQTELQQALYMYGSVYIGVALPDFATSGNMLRVPWDVPPGGPVGDAAPDPQNGHCIPAVAYDGEGVTVVTWGEVKSMTYSFYNAYADEVYVVLSQDVIGTGSTVAGFDLATLEKDLEQF